LPTWHRRLRTGEGLAVWPLGIKGGLEVDSFKNDSINPDRSGSRPSIQAVANTILQTLRILRIPPTLNTYGPRNRSLPSTG
jgi:hypothetical protein